MFIQNQQVHKLKIISFQLLFNAVINFQLPQIGHFIFLTLKTLNIYEVPQYELERMLLMPRASRTLAMLLTSLLSSPQQRQKLSEKPYMPYKVWARKLAHKTLLWYRCYYRENRDAQKVSSCVPKM